jgi:hypothetical protein
VTGTVVTAAVFDAAVADAAVLAASGVLLAVLLLDDELPHAAAPTVMAPRAPTTATERSVRDFVIKAGLSEVVS